MIDPTKPCVSCGHTFPWHLAGIYPCELRAAEMLALYATLPSDVVADGLLIDRIYPVIGVAC